MLQVLPELLRSISHRTTYTRLAFIEKVSVSYTYVLQQLHKTVNIL
jgi:hypothetical protein